MENIENVEKVENVENIEQPIPAPKITKITKEELLIQADIQEFEKEIKEIVSQPGIKLSSKIINETLNKK